MIYIDTETSGLYGSELITIAWSVDDGITHTHQVQTSTVRETMDLIEFIRTKEMDELSSLVEARQLKQVYEVFERLPKDWVPANHTEEIAEAWGTCMSQADGYEVYNIPVSEIFLDKGFNCRPAIPLNTVNDLANSIKDSRLEAPIIIQPGEDVPGGIPAGFRWRIVAGHRRFLACSKLLKWTHIPAILRPGLTDQAARLLNFTENLDRQDLTLFEEARALQSICQDQSMQEIQTRVNRGPRWVRVRLELMKLPEEVQQAAAAGIVTQLDIQQYMEQQRPYGFFGQLAEQKKLGLSSIEIYRRSRGLGVRRKREIQDMIAELMTGDFQVSAPRALAWALNTISTEELRAEISGDSGESA